MDIYLAGTPVTLTLPLLDKAGNTIEASAVEYRVLKNDTVELQALTAVDTFEPDVGMSEVEVTVSAELNAVAALDPMSLTSAQIDSVNPRESRTVELYLTVGSNTILLSHSYIIEPTNVLIVGLNTFQTLAQAEMTSLEVPGLDRWNAATSFAKTAALVEARINICQLRFTLLNSNINWGQDNLNFIPEGQYQTPYAGQAMFMFNGNLSLMTPAQYSKLPPRFKVALCKAQVAHADSLLGGGESIDQKRQEGLMLDTIGETKQMYRASKPIDLPVSKRALKYLSAFVTFAKHIGRG